MQRPAQRDGGGDGQVGGSRPKDGDWVEGRQQEWTEPELNVPPAPLDVLQGEPPPGHGLDRSSDCSCD